MSPGGADENYTAHQPEVGEQWESIHSAEPFAESVTLSSIIAATDRTRVEQGSWKMASTGAIHMIPGAAPTTFNYATEINGFLRGELGYDVDMLFFMGGRCTVNALGFLTEAIGMLIRIYSTGATIPDPESFLKHIDVTPVYIGGATVTLSGDTGTIDAGSFNVFGDYHFRCVWSGKSMTLLFAGEVVASVAWDEDAPLAEGTVMFSFSLANMVDETFPQPRTGSMKGLYV